MDISFTGSRTERVRQMHTIELVALMRVCGDNLERMILQVFAF